jgi:hypothetical protein
VFYPGTSVPTWDIAYPDGFARLRDIGLGVTAVAAGDLSGQTALPPVIQRRLRGVQRLWVIEMGSSWRPPGIVLQPAFRLVAKYQMGSIRMWLYVRTPGRAGPGGAVR